MQALAGWLGAAAAASVGGTLLELLCPEGKNGLDKYVKFVAAAAVLAVLIGPIFSLPGQIEDFLDQTGINSQSENINITQQYQTDKWILSQTLESLTDGVKQLAKQKFATDIEVSFDTDIDIDGIEIRKIYISCQSGTLYAKQLEIAQYLSDYLGIEVMLKNED